MNKGGMDPPLNSSTNQVRKLSETVLHGQWIPPLVSQQGSTERFAHHRLGQLRAKDTITVVHHLFHQQVFRRRGPPAYASGLHWSHAQAGPTHLASHPLPPIQRPGDAAI